MPAFLIIKNGRVIDPAAKRDKVSDVFIADGKFVKTLTPAQKKTAQVIDARGLVVCPGLVDIHVHFREPGQTHKETILTGSQAAAAGGFTSVVCMPNTSPVADNTGTIQLINAAAANAPVHVYATGCITVGMKGQQLAPHGSLKKAGVVALTDDGLCVQSNELMHRAVEYAKMFDLTILDHCQDESMTDKAVMNEGVMSTRFIHMQHISSAHSVELMRRAKQDKVNVTAEATPHHIALTEDALGTYDTNLKMNPPLRTEADRQAIIAGLKDGTLDCIGTDHAPHSPEEKDREFDYAPNGIIGLETALPICLDVLVRKSKFKLTQVIDLMTRKAANILKLPAGTLAAGAVADVCIFNPNETWLYNTYGAFSKSINSPWNQQQLTGRVKTTIVAGKIVYANGKMV
ncbi:MAG: dihydroorotase [Opitutaceae bacterium]|nr:dihydroorotase [Opitutaceae bacterium]